MIFPRDIISMGNGCIAISLEKPKLKIGSPILKYRPLVTYNGQSWYASRLSYHLNVDAIPRRPRNKTDGLVLHSCDHNWCIEPSHLYLGTSKQNMIDRSNRNKSFRKNMSNSKIGNSNALEKHWELNEETKMKMSKSMMGNQNGKRREMNKNNHNNRVTAKAGSSQQSKLNTKGEIKKKIPRPITLPSVNKRSQHGKGAR